MKSKSAGGYKRVGRRLCDIGVVLMAVILMSACKSELYSEISEREANEMMSILRRSGVDTDKVALKDGLYAIRVEHGQMSRATDILSAYGYPQEKFQNMGELFKKEGLVSSPLEERVRYVYALSQSLSETLLQIDGVITARVNIVLPEHDSLSRDTKPSSASVFIKYHPASKLEDAKSDIKMIIEKSIEGLSYDEVSLVMLPGRDISTPFAAGADEDGAGAAIAWTVLVCALVAGLLYVYGGANRRAPPAGIRPVGFPGGGKKPVAKDGEEDNTDAVA
ncbi:EscJ/YscJ/HrcJ family type III secretion inner membrane ring protein [Exilibacterium tricleocarpae]|uniref:Lipoprotein n=1 Tax=Exilibacterium tricleocarpae TaxID=2591008 RepID=A0A545SYA0_9GAMM|nr:type III secretion inner membrane ring lipoprotein SctJ [Exilibacterium tricleocarpae]TQV69944.1 EscJ/YscJ/HrcJ family type III secretion inner membrane ring protein [Exilibacterium tricleocarpae]